jgi:DNA-binding beta-propeller fold protein YncE
MRRLLLTLLTVAGLVLAAFTLSFDGAKAHRGPDGGFEVWTVDQSNTTGTTHGGTLYVYRGSELRGPRAQRATPERIDLGGQATALCAARTGTVPVRPHMLMFSPARSHAVLAFVVSGHVLFIDAETRTPVACVDVGAQAHAAMPSPDGRYVIVANQNGKLLQRIATDWVTNTFTLESAATIDLATCTTPSGAPCQDPALRPDNAPICPLVDSGSRFAFVTLRGGGLFVVDIRSTPMRIVAEYDRATVHPNGCGGLEHDGKMYVNSGGGTASNLSEFDVYSFRLRRFSTTPAPPNTPAPTLVLSQDDRALTDSHGATLTRHGRYLWVADRAGNRIVVIDTDDDELANEISLVGGLSNDPSADLLDTSPRGDRVFASLRGSLPLSGDPHVSTGSTPGVGVFRVTEGGRSGVFAGISRISNLDQGGIDRADPHALRVRAPAAGRDDDDDDDEEEDDE